MSATFLAPETLFAPPRIPTCVTFLALLIDPSQDFDTVSFSPTGILPYFLAQSRNLFTSLSPDRTDLPSHLHTDGRPNGRRSRRVPRSANEESRAPQPAIDHPRSRAGMDLLPRRLPRRGEGSDINWEFDLMVVG